MTEKQESEFVFVYGTLKKGKSAHKFLKGAEFLGEGHIKGTMYGHGLVPYPMIKLNNPDGVVLGEVYDVPAELMAAMDKYEGHPHHYKRVEVPIFDKDDPNDTPTDDAAYAWVYEYQGSVEGLDVIKSGVF